MTTSAVPESDCCRRDFLKGSLSCGAYTLLALAATSTANQRAFAQATSSDSAAKTPFAHVDKISDGVWSVISTPLAGDFTTISNGGIIAGDDAVLVIEGFQTVKGGAWLRELCKELTGRYPTHVALTHYHPDHSNGLAGYFGGDSAPTVIATQGTRDLLLAMHGALPMEDEPSGLASVVVGGVAPVVGVPGIIPATLLPDGGTAKLDLGGRIVNLRQYAGHTPSDMTIALEDPHVTWCGDLFFNGLFPNYRDAVPASLTKNCKAILGDATSTFIPGHGSVASDSQIKNYLGLLDTVEEAARAGLGKGQSPKEVAAAFTLPDSLGQWVLYDPTLYETAFTAWQRALA